MEDIWNQLDFGKPRPLGETSKGSSGASGPPIPFLPSEEKESTFDPSFFSPPNKNVRLLRELSMKGKVDMELMSEKVKGRPKLIWGEPEAYIDQVEMNDVLSETDVVDANEVAGEPFVVCEEAVLVDEDIRTGEELANPLTEERR